MNSYKTARGSFSYCQIVYSVILYDFVLYNSYKKCMNWYKNHIVYEFVLYNLYNNCMNYIVWIRTKTTLTNSTYMNSYKSVGWNSKKKHVWKNGGSPLAPGIAESVDKCTKTNKIQSQKWQYEIAHMYNYVRKNSRHRPQKRIIRFQWNGI